jgi:cytosine/adenosine deaminase-related metal-dependent hydrolase
MILTSSKLITCTPRSDVIDQGAVVIKKGIIRAVGQLGNLARRYTDKKIIHLQNAVLMPGLVNVHTHLELPSLLDTVRSKTFADWVLNLIRAKKKLTNKKYSAATQNNISVLIQTGTTTVGEICTQGISPDKLRQSGLRAVVFYEIIDMGPCGSRRETRIFSFSHRDTALVHYGLSPHAPYTVSEAVMCVIRKEAQKKVIPIAMHVAESKDEIRLLQRKKSGLEKLYRFAGWHLDCAPIGSSSFEFLNRIGFLSPHILAVHAVQVTDNDIGLIKSNKISIAHGPRSNRETSVGKMPLKMFLDAGIAVGLGTDSLASSPNLNLWDEMRYAYRIHRHDGLTPRNIILLGTSGGARTLGMDDIIGSLAPGMKADVIAVALPSKNTGDIYSDLLRETKSCIMTMTNGKILFQKGDILQPT